MERNTPDLEKDLNEDFRKSLFLWQSSPDDPIAIGKIKNLIYTTSGMGFGITFNIKGETFLTSEGRRAIMPRDIRKFSKFDGSDFVFKFGPPKNKTAEYTLTAKLLYGQPLLILHGRHEGMIGMFRPHEIDSIAIL